MSSFGLILATVGSAVVFFTPFADAFGFIKVAGGFVGASLLWLTARPRRTPIDAPLAACTGAFLLSWAYSVDPISGLLGVYTQPFHGLAAFLPAVLIFYAASSRPTDVPFYCAALIALVNGLACAAQLAGLIPHPFGMVGPRALGFMGSPVFTGAILAPCIPAALWIGLRGGWVGVLGISGSVGGFLALTACGSRGPFLAVAAGLLASMAASGRVRNGKAAIFAILATLGILGAFMGVRNAKSDRGRLLTWELAARAGFHHPVLGWGPDAFPLANRALKTPVMIRRGSDGLIQASAHNDMLQAWATTGALGLLAYLWLWAEIIYALSREVAWEKLLDMGGDDITVDRTAAVLGSMAALFFVAKVNPVPPSALYISAALLGAVIPSWTAERSWLWALGLTAVISTALPVSRQMMAEANFSFGNIALKNGDLKTGADLLRQANEAQPSNAEYANSRIMLLMQLSDPNIESPRREFGKRMLRAAAGVVKGHPHDPAAYELMATTELFAGQFFGKGLAHASMRSAKRAAELDPLMIFSAHQWQRAALVSGDEKEADKAQTRIDDIQSSSRKNNP